MSKRFYTKSASRGNCLICGKGKVHIKIEFTICECPVPAEVRKVLEAFLQGRQP